MIVHALSSVFDVVISFSVHSISDKSPTRESIENRVYHISESEIAQLGAPRLRSFHDMELIV